MLIQLPYKILAVAILVFIAFVAGYKKGDERANVEITKYANKVEQLEIALEKEQQNIKEKVVTEYIDKVRVVKEKEYVIQDKIKNIVPSQYYLSNGWVYTHNYSTSAEDGVPDTTRAADDSSSTVKDNQALGTIVSNYSTCLQIAEQLTALQDWIIKTKETVDKNE